MMASAVFALEQLGEHVQRVVLPPLTAVRGPWLAPTAVHVVPGPAPVLIDTGLRSSRTALLQALEACGVTPAAVQRVLLTSFGPAAVGNLDVFPNAAILCSEDAAPLDSWRHHPAEAIRARFRIVLDALCESGAVAEEAAIEHLAEVTNVLDSGAVPHERVVVLPDGARVASTGGALRLYAAPGMEPRSAAWLDEEAGILLGGRTLVFDESFPLRDVRQTLDSLDRLSQLQPRLVSSIGGPVEADFRAAFRSLGLLFHGALSHLPYAFSGKTSAVELATRDLGGSAESPMGLAARTLRYMALLEELHRSGILEREGSGPAARYAGGTAQGSRTAALLKELESRRTRGGSRPGEPTESG